ncbi:MAG: hypothetical protein AAGF07_05185 [Patescibacteria group bacterium]
MPKDPLKILVTVTIGILLLVLSVWLINLYVVPAIFKSRIGSGSTTRIGEVRTDSEKKHHTEDNNDMSEPDSEKVDSNIESELVNSDPAEVNNDLPVAKSESNSDNPDLSKVNKQKPTPKKPDLEASTNRGDWDKYKGAYEI